MNFEISRVYREIIENVTKSLLSDSEVTSLNHEEIFKLKTQWSQKLREMTMPNERPTHFRDMDNIMPSYLSNKNKFADYSHDKSSDSQSVVNTSYENVNKVNDSDEDSDQILETMFPNYMMCLYTKVDKSKYKWKVKLKQGFLNVGKMEYAFDTANGDLAW